MKQSLYTLILLFTINISIGQSIVKEEVEIIEQNRPSLHRGETIKEIIKIKHYFLSDGERFSIATSYPFDEYMSSLNRSSPANLSTNIPWDEDPNTAGDQATYANNTVAEAAYNNGRRKEEIELGLTPNILGNLVIPAGIADDELAFFIFNDERAVRHNIDYGAGAVTVLPIQDIEYHIDTLASHHLQDMLANEFFSHNGTNGLNPFQRIDADGGIGNTACGGAPGHSFLPRSENIYVAFSSAAANPLIIQRALYEFSYNDGPSWGHREANFLGDQALNGQSGFNDDFGTTGSEGFIGFSVDGVNNGDYNPFNFGAWLDRSDLLVMNYFDPVNTSCTYDVGTSGLSVLPVEFVSFDAVKRENDNHLAWSVYEENVSHYEIEQSIDGKTWSYVDTKVALQQNGYLKNYQFLHGKMSNTSLIYYRLKVVDFDNSYSYSPARTIQRNRINEEISLYPNPTTGKIYLNLKDTYIDYEIIDLSGKTFIYNNIEAEIDCLSLPAGFYILRIYTSNGVISQKLQKM